MAQLPSESLKIFVFQFSQHITLLTAKFSMAGLFQIYENVNMTQQLEIQHSEKSERENNLIWELFIWHALIIMWVHECIYIWAKILSVPDTSVTYFVLHSLIQFTDETKQCMPVQINTGAKFCSTISF